jgi:hypothetical protein
MTRARDLADLGSGITSGDLADDSITTAKVADANVTQAKLAGEAVNESKLQVSNAPVNGYTLTAQSGNTGGLTWAEAASGHWTNLAEVTLGGSSVSAIDITLPTGYDVLKLDIRLPVCVGSTAKKLEMKLLDSSNAADQFSYATDVFESNESRVQENGKLSTDLVLSPIYGSNSLDYCFYSIQFLDVDSSSVHTKFQGQGSGYENNNSKGANMLSSGIQYNDAAVTSKVRFVLSGGTSFASDDGCYYRLYGHSYS